MKYLNKLFLFFFFLSGLASLIYEVIWIKQFGLIFGTTVYAVSAVISIFMLGLGLGAYLFGKLADKIRKPILFYGLLELGIAIYGFLFPKIFLLAEKIVIMFYQFSFINNYELLVKIILTFLFLIIPTILMGGTFPLLSKYFINKKKIIGFKIGELYALNSYGGFVGVLLSAYILIPILGLQKSIFFAATINLIIGLLSIFLSKKIPLIKLKSYAYEKLKLNKEAIYVLLIFFITGFVALSYETLWFRMLMPVLGLSVYSLAIMLASFLWGIATGSLFYSRRLLKIKNNYCYLSLMLILTSLSSTIILLLFYYELLFLEFTKYFILSIPTFFLGIIFPLLNKIYISKIKFLGKKIGLGYLFNILGGIFGSLLTGFFLLKLLGLKNGILLMNLIIIITGLVLLIKLKFKRKKLLLMFTSILVIILISLFFVKIELNKNIIFYEEGITLTAQVKDYTSQLSLIINGKSLGSTGESDSKIQKLLAHLPLLIHNNPQSMLIIGLGTSMTTGSASLYKIPILETVEISPEVVRAANLFKEHNYDVMNNNHSKIIVDDARNYLLKTDNKYDVISAEPMDPYISGSGNILTREYFEIVNDSLNQNGIVAQWVPLYRMTQNNINTMLATFLEVFPEVTVWYSTSELVLLGSNEKLSIDYNLINKQLIKTNILSDLQIVNINSTEELLSHFLFGKDTVKELAENAVINTDDFPIIEYMSPKVSHFKTTNWNKKFLFSYKQAFSSQYKINDDAIKKRIFNYENELFNISNQG